MFAIWTTYFNSLLLTAMSLDLIYFSWWFCKVNDLLDAGRLVPEEDQVDREGAHDDGLGHAELQHDVEVHGAHKNVLDLREKRAKR